MPPPNPHDHPGVPPLTTRPTPAPASPPEADLRGLVGDLNRLAAELRSLYELAEAATARRPEANLLDAKAVAEQLGVCERTLDRLVAEGKLPVTRIGGLRRFTPAAVDAFVRASTGTRRRQSARRRSP